MPRVTVTIPTAWMRNAARSGRSYDEISDMIERNFGIQRSRSWVSKELKKLGESRHFPRKDLIPWDVKPEHKKSNIYLMLQAESRRRSGNQLSKTDVKYVSQLDELMLARGISLIISYCPIIGFYLQPRQESDQDIIREETQCPRAGNALVG